VKAGRRIAGLLAIAVALAGPLLDRVAAHSGLRFSSPLDGATLGDSPTLVQLTFLEKPEISLSTIRVVDTQGRAYHADRPEAVDGDPLSMAVRLRPLDRGIYTVQWRVVSAVDGHASSGAYVFGVRADPSGSQATGNPESSVSTVEGIARSIFLAGLVVALGAAAAAVGGFGPGYALWPASIGWMLSIAGVTLLIIAQARVADAGLRELSETAIGRALVWRAIAVAAMGVALAVAALATRVARPRVVRIGHCGVALAALSAIAVHASAGHAGAGRWPVGSTIAFQATHFAAVGLWLGGLAALLAGMTGPASGAQAQSVRRFSTIAATGLAIVTITGIVRSVQELAGWGDLTSTSYGGVVLAKVSLLVVIAALGAINRWSNVPMAAFNLDPLRRTARLELALAAIALTAAGFLGALPPPAANGSIAGIDVSGSDYGTTVRARLTAVSDQPGPNRFAVWVSDYDSHAAVVADRVSLRFTPLDDPDVASTVLVLKPAPEDSYSGAGANLSFDGRWRVNILVERGGRAVEVPVELEARSQRQFISILRPVNERPSYTIEVKGVGHVRISADPEKVGRSQLHITCLSGIYEQLPISNLIATSGMGASVRQLPVTRQNRNSFVAEVELKRGSNHFSVVARTNDGTRLRASTTINISGSDLPD